MWLVHFLQTTLSLSVSAETGFEQFFFLEYGREPGTSVHFIHFAAAAVGNDRMYEMYRDDVTNEMFSGWQLLTEGLLLVAYILPALL